jgi:hypothetical protein
VRRPRLSENTSSTLTKTILRDRSQTICALHRLSAAAADWLFAAEAAICTVNDVMTNHSPES